VRAAARAVCLIVASLSLVASPAEASACANADLTPSSENLQAVRASVLCLLNDERASRGMRRLRANAKLRKAAERHSRNMNLRDFFDHVSPAGTTPLQRVKAAGYLSGAQSWMVGENIAWGEQQLSTPREIMRAWMESPGHKANILDRRFRHVGIGIAVGAPVDGGGGATYTTAFGKRS
jgi:uncharacterized protein YkwD